MDNNRLLLRVIVASPGDVSAERDIVPLVVEEINRSIGVDRGVLLEVVRWETDTHPGFHADGPQGLIDPLLRIEDSDLLIGIFWKRFGTPTRDASSGTEHEIRLAIDGLMKHGRPQVFVYFNEKSATPHSPQEATQWAQVLSFRESFPAQGLFWPYNGSFEFEKLLRTHLTNFLRHQFSPKLPEPAIKPASSSDYFAVLSQVIEEHASTYVGREDARGAVEAFIHSQPGGHIFVHGGPGQGKTSFCADLIRRNGYVHHLAGISGGRSDLRLILKSLLAQMTRSMKPAPQIPSSLPELSKLWEELLILQSQTERIVIVLDGLDELPEESIDDLRFLLPERLPRQVFLVVALRPGCLLEALKDTTSTAPHLDYELLPLESADLERLIRNEIPTVSQGVLDKIKEAALGNPLYVRSLLNELKIRPDFDLNDLPPTLHGFFRHATRFVSKTEGKAARSVLGLLAVAYEPLSVSGMQQITRLTQREIYHDVVDVLGPFLVQAGLTYRLYHRSFREFVLDTLLFRDEIIDAHGMIAKWLAGTARDTDYGWRFLAHHLLESGDYEGLVQQISIPFLVEKSRRYGFAVLDDIECVIRAMLLTSHPSAVERCVKLVEELRSFDGESILREATRSLGPSSLLDRIHEETFDTQRTSIIKGLDSYITSTAAADVTADFCKIVRTDTGCLLAIGDAPGRGLKSAFVGRFIGHLFQAKARIETRPKVLLEEINFALSTFDYFDRVSMQCVLVDLVNGIFTISNAGHPALAHFSTRRQKCDPLWVPGELLHDSSRQTRRLSDYENYLGEIEAGDVLILLTDGLLEYHRLDGESYGYRFTTIVEKNAELSAREIGEAIILDWRAHAKSEEYRDDVMLMVVAIRDRSA